MKYLSLPLNLIQFWYVDSFGFFKRSLVHSVSYLEEDLAVSLMWRLLFVPLFHDSSILGRILSFVFRLTRILIGLAALVLVAVVVLVLALGWYLLPVGLVYTINNPSLLVWILRGIFFAGLVYFLEYKLTHPAKLFAEIKDSSGLWQASQISASKISWTNLLKQHKVLNILERLELSLDQFASVVPIQSPINLSQVAEILIKRRGEIKDSYLEATQIFLAALESTPEIESHLLKLNLNLSDFKEAADFQSLQDIHWRVVPVWDQYFEVKHLKGVNRGWLSTPTPTLDLYTEDLTHKVASEGAEDFIGRESVVKQVISDLAVEKGGNILLIGEPGAGKTTLLEYLAKMIIRGDAPQTLATKRLVKLDSSHLLAGIENQGQLADRLKQMFEDVRLSQQIIFCLEEIEDLGVGQVSQEFNLYALLLPYLESSDLQFIGTTTPENYRLIVQKNGNFSRIFHTVQLSPASESETLDALKIRAIETERYQKIRTSILALKEIVHLAERYKAERVLPDSAIQILEEAITKAENGWIKKSTIDQLIQDQTNVPIVEAEGDQKQELLNLESIIHRQYIDQEEAVTTIATALRRNAAHLRDQHRPVGSFLFVGPTGVGKTEIAKVLSNILFQGQMHRFDMSEFQTTESVDRLLEELTGVVMQRPYSVILLDEFEKAEPQILNLFLQVLEDGRLTDAQGKTADFTNTIVIATSNAASVFIAEGLSHGKTIQDIKPAVDDELLKEFKPELINRFDEVVIFKPLAETDLKLIVHLKLDELSKQLKEQGYLVSFSPALVDQLAHRGVDPTLGARPLRRLIQDTLEARLSVMILENKLAKGQEFVMDVDHLSLPGSYPGR